MNDILPDLIVVVIGGLFTAICTALFTAYLTTKKHEIHINYMKETIEQLRSSIEEHNKRLYRVENKVVNKMIAVK